uniref:Armadillo repeat containing 6 n=1 Tax=Astyanax mexicanus TaxID=7994 RepID=A0A8B9H9I3_ASTMX
MAKRRITQETFDAVVRENIDEFEMDESEALREAIEQFESQGVDLSSIVKAVPKASSEETTEDQTHEVLQALESLRTALESSSTSMLADLKLFTEQCSLGFAQRYLAAQKEAYPTILSCCQSADEDKQKLSAALAALSALTDGQPDLLDAEGQGFLIGTLRTHQEDPALTCLAVQTVRHCCLKHEQNRQDLVKAGVLRLLAGAITKHVKRPEVVKEACIALRVMTFDDDVRVPFGHAHEHAKMIVLEQNGLKVIVEAAKAHPENMSVLSELCATLSRLAVRNEFCQDIVDLGGLKFMMTLLANSLDCQVIILVLKLSIGAVLTASRIGGHEEIIKVRSVVSCIQNLQKNAKLNYISLFTLLVTQKQSCMLLRNLVARTRDFSQPILEMGAEALIGQALASHRDCGDVGRAALRDLGCQVELRELWTGNKGSLAN